MKITYKFDEKELFDFNMFRAMRKNSNTVTRAIFISCGYLAVLLLIGYWVKFPWWVYLIFTAAAVLLFFGMIWFTRNRMKHFVRVLMYRQSREVLCPDYPDLGGRLSESVYRHPNQRGGLWGCGTGGNDQAVSLYFADGKRGIGRASPGF